MQRIEDNLFALIAARMAGNDLPAAKTRVARLMVRVASGPITPKYDVKLQVAGSGDAKPISGATASLSEGAAQ